MITDGDFAIAIHAAAQVRGLPWPEYKTVMAFDYFNYNQCGSVMSVRDDVFLSYPNLIN